MQRPRPRRTLTARRPQLIRSIPLLAPVVLAASMAWGQAQLEAPTPAQWATDVWSSADRGDMRTLTRLLAHPPRDVPDEVGKRYRASLELHKSNSDQARTRQVESRDEAMVELRERLAAGENVKAMRSAIQVQDLSESFDAALENGEIQQTIAWAKGEIPLAEAKNDWLYAQELLFLLRTLYEDTHRPEMYVEYDHNLDRVNRRVSLLAQYAPQHLHDLRVKAAERNGDDAPEPFNPGTAVNWRERIDGVKHGMLKAAMRIAAREHIETEGNAGWRSLITGGLESLRTFSTTPGLEATFPGLADDVLREEWVQEINDELAKLAMADDDDLDSWAVGKLIDRLINANRRTVALDKEIIYREFGDGAIHKFDEEFDDPYSEVIWPDKLRRFQQATEGNFIGVGILIRHNEKRDIMVVNPLEGTPAYFAGVKPNDLIIEVDGDATVGWSLNDAVDQITGPKGETVVLGIQREGEPELIEIPIDRDVIKLRTVKGWWKDSLDEDGTPEWDWYIDPVSRIAYVRLSQFTEDSYLDLRAAWREINEKGRPLGLIFDLRYNPGGLLTSAVQIGNLFVEEGVIVSGEDKHGNKAFPDQLADPRHAEFFGVPTVVLINKGSASASEIVAGCLQAHGAAVIVGERSYGKGSVQTVHHIANDARLKLTTHYYRLPAAEGEDRGRLVHKRPGAEMWGVDPDVEVKMTTTQVVDSIELRQAADIIPSNDEGELDPDSPERTPVSELLTRGLDPQLQTALLILQAQALGSREMEEVHARR